MNGERRGFFSDEPTGMLMQRFVNSGLLVDTIVAEEIVRRKDAASLRPFLEKEEYWNADGPSEGWAPVHTLFILGLMGNREALEALRYALMERAEELGDMMTEDIPRILFAFGKGFSRELEEMAFDASLDMYARLAALRALCTHAVVSPETIRTVAGLCSRFLKDGNEELVALALPCIAEVKDELLFREVLETWHSLSYAKKVTDPEDLKNIYDGTTGIKPHLHCTGDLWEHFSEENLRRYERAAGMIFGRDAGRNEPCPCGSGRKYKKCCLRASRKA